MLTDVFDGQDVLTFAELVRSYGGRVIRADLAELYDPGTQRHAISPIRYTSLSDGKYIFTDDQITVADADLAWDIVHLFAHMVQWNADAAVAQNCGMHFYGDAARTLAQRDFRRASATEINLVIDYEMSAHAIAFAAILKAKNETATSKLAERVRMVAQLDLSQLVAFYMGLPIYESRFLDTELGQRIRTASIEMAYIDPPPPNELRFQSFDLLSVPVIHFDRANLAGIGQTVAQLRIV